MKQKLLITLMLAVMLVLGRTEMWGQILTFEFSSLAGNEVSAPSNSNDANLTSSTITRGAGLTASSNGGRFNATNWALTSISEAVTGNKYMEFTITPNSGYQFSVSSIYIQLQRSSTGPRGIAIRNSLDSYAANLDQEYAISDVTTTQNFTFTFSQSNSSVPVTYRVYMWAEATGGTGGIGDGSGNDIVVLGTTSLVGGPPVVATPTFDPPGGNCYSTQNVTITTITEGATIYYTTDGTDPDNSSTEFTTPVEISATTTLKAIAYASSYDPSAIATAVYTFPIEVANIAALRAGTTDGTPYRLTGEAVLTFKSVSNNVKYIQDATGAIMIFDNTGKITTNYDLYDGITGLQGTLLSYFNMIEFIPALDPGAATSAGNTVTPVEVTLNNLDNTYQAKLVKVVEVSHSETGNYVQNHNYTITDPSGSGILRTAYSDLNYIGTPISTVPQDMTGVVLQYNSNMQLVPRSLSDFTYPITFYVDMSNAGSFTYVEVVGDFQDPAWSGTAMTLVSNNIYTYTTDAIFYEGDAIEFKFRTDGTNWEGGNNRTHTVVAGSNTYNAVWNLMIPAVISWANLQWPENGNIYTGETFNVYAQAYAEGITYSPGASQNLSCWIGYSTEDTDPSTWTNWIETSFYIQQGNNDEFVANLGASLTAGTYYYASRFKLGGCDYVYGGYNGGFWDGINNVSGVITVEDYVITTFPYTQSFDGEMFAPVGWTNIKTADPVDPNSWPEIWDRQTTGIDPACSPHSGTAMARYNCYSLHYGTKAELTTPSITFPDDGYKVSFWMYRDTNPWGYEGFIYDSVNVYYNTTNSSTGGTLLGTIYREATQAPVVGSDGWYQYSFNMPSSSAGSNRYIVFEGFSGNGLNIFIDDVTIEAFATTTWTGSTDNDWATETNWDNGVPNGTTNVVIPAGLTNYPTLSASGECFNFTIESTATGDASILGDNYLTVNGSVSVERYITGGVWHDLSASTQNQTVNNLYFNGTPDVWLKSYNEPDNSRTNITSLSAPLSSGAGFEIWVETGNNVTVSFDGPLKTANVTLTTSSTPPLSYSGAEPLGYNLIGNPFASPLDWDEGTWALSNMTDGIWVWNGSTYLDWVGGVGSLTGGIIPMGQGFFVQTTSGTPSITIPMDARVHNSQSYYKGTTTTPDHMWIKAIKGDKTDQLTIVFAEDATEGFDNGRDSRKMLAFNGNAPQIYALEQDEKFGVDGLPTLAETGRTVSVMYHVGESGEQRLLANLESLPEATVVLEDKLTGTVQDLNENPEYIFEAERGDDPDRFTLFFNPTPTTLNELNNNADLHVYAFKNELYIRSTGDAASTSKSVWVYDTYGRLILNTIIPPSTLTQLPLDVKNTPVIVKVVGSGSVVTTKVVIN